MFMVPIFIIVSLVLIHLYWYNGRIGKHLKKIHGPTLRPLVGNLLCFREKYGGIFETYRYLSKKYYPTYRLWIGTQGTINICHPDDLKVILNNPKYITKKFGYEHVRLWLHDGVLLSVGDKWHERRKLLLPAFNFSAFENYNELVNAHGEKILNELLMSDENESVQNLRPFITKYFMNVLFESTIGVPFESLETNQKVSFKSGAYLIGKILSYRILRPYIKDWMIPFMPGLNKSVTEATKSFQNFVDKAVQDRREYHKTHISKCGLDMSSCDVYPGKDPTQSTIDILLSAEQNGLIEDAGIKEEIGTLSIVGLDAPITSFIYTIMLLAENKDAQDRARTEVEMIMSGKNGKLTVSDVRKMEYLGRCLKESLRLFPSVPLIERYLTEDVQFKNFLAPKGSHILLHILDAHKDPNFWSDPEKFDPDRFLPDNVKDRHPFSYIPFSAGPRNCIGQKVATIAIKSLLSHILYNFYLEPVDFIKDVEVASDIVMKPKHRVHAKFIKIHR